MDDTSNLDFVDSFCLLPTKDQYANFKILKDFNRFAYCGYLFKVNVIFHYMPNSWPNIYFEIGVKDYDILDYEDSFYYLFEHNEEFDLDIAYELMLKYKEYYYDKQDYKKQFIYKGDQLVFNF